jgi:hypothetical protein
MKNNFVNTSEIFKRCNNCSWVWKDREDFLSDPHIPIIGYTANFKELETGVFLFNHKCKTTIATSSHYFRDLYDGPVFQERLTGSYECPGYCLYQRELGHCIAKCECAYVREIIQIIKKWPKTGVQVDLS